MEKTLKEVISDLTEQGIMPVALVSTTPYRTQRNYLQTPRSYEKTNLPSETIPDQSLSIRELVYRYTHGLSLGGSRVPVYEGDDDIEYPANWDKLDISERHDWYEEQTTELKELQERLQAKKNADIEAQRQKDIEEAVQKKLDAVRNSRKDITTDEEPK